ncbi:polyketide cyclase [Halobacteriales archaeon QS_1_68_20]|nr:MAG: polyketide cyclase [Halobacteriales archaeon QS_1_68_20]
MTVQVERTFDLSAPPEEVWAFISDAGKRAGAISVVESYELHDEDGERATWHVSLPIPLVRGTVSVETEQLERDPPRYVRFVGRSKVMRVVGEHELEEIEDGTRLHNRFQVKGKLPGVETFFERNFQDELRNLERAIEDDLGVSMDEE